MTNDKDKLPKSTFLQKKIKLETKKKFIKEDRIFEKEEKKDTKVQYDKRDVTIYVANLNYKRDEDGIKKLFSPFGKVKDVYILTDKKTKLKTGVAFVRMFNKDEAKEAIKKLNGKEVDGRSLKVSIAEDNKDSRPKK